MSSDNSESPLASIASESATIYGESSPVTGALEEQKQAVTTGPTPSDRMLSTSIHAAATTATSYRGHRQNQRHSDTVVRGKEETRQNANSIGLGSALANQPTIAMQLANASPEQEVSLLTDFGMDIVSDGWTLSPDVAAEHESDQVGNLAFLLHMIS